MVDSTAMLRMAVCLPLILMLAAQPPATRRDNFREVLHGVEVIDGDVAAAVFYEATGEQAALPERVAAVAVAQFVVFGLQRKRLFRLGRSQQVERPGIGRIAGERAGDDDIEIAADDCRLSLPHRRSPRSGAVASPDPSRGSGR